MGNKINYKKLEKIALETDPYFKEQFAHSFLSWACKNCKKCNCKLLETCLQKNCSKVQKFYKTGYYRNLFFCMPEYRLMKIKKRGRIYEETWEGITRKVGAARKEHKCDWCGKTIRVGSPYLSTIDFSQRKVLCSCDDCHITIIWMYGD